LKIHYIQKIGSLPTIKYPQPPSSKLDFFSQLSSDAEYKQKLIAGTTVAASLTQLPKRSALWVSCTSAIFNTKGQTFSYALGFLRSLAVSPQGVPRNEL